MQDSQTSFYSRLSSMDFFQRDSGNVFSPAFNPKPAPSPTLNQASNYTTRIRHLCPQSILMGKNVTNVTEPYSLLKKNWEQRREKNFPMVRRAQEQVYRIPLGLSKFDFKNQFICVIIKWKQVHRTYRCADTFLNVWPRELQTDGIREMAGWRGPVLPY